MVKWAGGQLGGKLVARLAVRLVAGITAKIAVKLAAFIGKEIIKWDEEALDALFNKTIKYLVINNYIFAIIKLYIWQLKGKALLLLQGAKLLVILKSVYYNKDQI